MFTALVVLTLSAVATASPQTWIVDAAGSGNFRDIPPALAAASDGDVILVRPGTYSGFKVTKKVTVKAETTLVDLNDAIQVDSIPSGPGGAVVSGFEIRTGTLPLLAVTNCSGDVVVDHLSLDDNSGQAASIIAISASASVNVYDCAALVHGSGDQPLASVSASTVRASRLYVQGGVGIYSASLAGQDAINVDGSTLVLHEPDVTGGYGVTVPIGSRIKPGKGGAGMVATNSTIWVVGDAAGRIRGGEGGSFFDPWTGYSYWGAAGGPGLTLSNAPCTVSRCTIAGGYGNPHGLEYDRDPYLRDDSYPVLFLEPELRVGQPTTLSLDAAGPGSAILLASDQGGVGDAGPKWLGPPLAILAGTSLFAVDLGTLDANGDWVETFTVTNDPAAAGMTWHLQAAVFDPSGALYLTNPVARTIGL